ncbi:MAG: AbrB/MazE/SpoVT family DNA-binding domain-containing protein [Ktedonobacteraceae bacterium]
MEENNAKEIKKIIRVSLTSKNQLTLPVEAQKYLGTSPQSTVELVLENGRAYIEPALMSIEDVYGSAKPKQPMNLGWEEAEQIAKDEHAENILNEMNRK